MYQHFISTNSGEAAAANKNEDPLIRREKFAVALRKQKRDLIIGSKRKKTLEAIRNQTEHRQNNNILQP